MDLKVTNHELDPNSDKILLPSNVLSVIVDEHGESLPHPLIFKLSHGNKHCFVGVKQFSSPDDTICLPQIIQEKLAVEDGDSLEVELSLNIPKGTSLSLKPLQFYPEINNWKYYLESNLTQSYTVLTKGDKLVLNNYEFSVEDCNADTISVIDTDIVLDIIPLNDIMAQQQLNFNVDKFMEIGTGNLDVKLVPFSVDSNVSIFKLDLMNITEDLVISFSTNEDYENVDLLIGLEKLINLENFMFTTMDRETKEVRVPYNVIEEVKNKCKYDLDQGFEIDEIAKWLYIVPFAWEFNSEIVLKVSQSNDTVMEIDHPQSDSKQCGNCKKFITRDKISLHEVFCYKNNILCECGEIFLRAIPKDHYHCPLCLKTSKSSLFKFKHEKLNHQQFQCQECEDGTIYDSHVEFIITHKPQCPHKLHECKFCHLVEKQGKATYIDNFEGLTNHENNCGNKTDECFKCNKLVKRKDMRKHVKLHQLDTKSSNDIFKITYNKCCNENCVNLINIPNDLKLCDICYGPLYSTLNDPTNIKLQSRIERKYMLQLSKGCEFTNCQNIYCKRKTTLSGVKEIMKFINEELFTYITTPNLPINKSRDTKPNKVWFCVNDVTNNKMILSQSFKEYPPEMVIKGLNEIKEINTETLSQWLSQNSL
ncbi:hypothetical protein CLIB1444_10S04632 [[Candida] jaroonii]|uniref:Uncharacterized protein n=1 Tax=[Candida] jaroonii TaxID=467808 RepID=A0ACA9YCQ1_9ASCO|nr:hypothetical protein CLIB1444_10S04632 [[Candida] jaroonii]